MNKYTNIKRQYNIKFHYYKSIKNWKIEEEFNLSENLKKLKHKNK